MGIKNIKLEIDKSYREGNDLYFEIRNSNLMSDKDKEELINDSNLYITEYGTNMSNIAIDKYGSSKEE